MRSEVGTTLGAYPLSALVSTEVEDQTMADVMRDITRKTAQRASDSFGVHIARGAYQAGSIFRRRTSRRCSAAWRPSASASRGSTAPKARRRPKRFAPRPTARRPSC